MPVTHVNTNLPEDLPAVVLSYAPPAPSRGGGRSKRRLRPPAWGIGPIATDPDLWAGGVPRRRLVRAATLTSVMGMAWGGPQLASTPPPAPDEVAATIDDAMAEDSDSSPVVGNRGNGGTASDDQGLRAARRGTSAAARPDSGSEADEGRADVGRANVIATYEDVDIVQPSAAVRMVGFHEGGSQADDVTPGATPDRDLGEQAVESTDRDDPLPSMVLPTRGRGTGPATAIDIAMPEGEKVYAPISGTVTAANQYSLYGEYPDTIITIQPDDHPEVMLEILHVEGARVEVGDRVVAGQTVIADTPNPLPFPSQIDRFVTENGKPLPHAHLEMQRV